MLQLLDRGERWRERSVETIQPLDSAHARRKVSYQFRISRPFLAEVLGVEFGKIPESLTWRQTVPIARLPKGALLQFSAEDDDGKPVKIANKMEGASHSATFLLAHYKQIAKKVGLGTFDQASLRLYFYLVAFCNPDILKKKADEARLWEGVAGESDLPTSLASAQAPHPAGDPQRVPLATNDRRATVADWLVAQVGPYVREPTVSSDWVMKTLAQLEAHGKDGVVVRARLAGIVYDPFLLLRDYAKAHAKSHSFRNVDEALLSFSRFSEEIRRSIGPILTVAEEENAPRAIREDCLRFLQEVFLMAQGWVAYADFDIRIDRPWLVKLERTHELSDDAPVGEHVFQVSFGDCQSTHVEITSPDPELEIFPAPYSPDGNLREIFGDAREKSGLVYHYYTSKRRFSTPAPKSIAEMQEPELVEAHRTVTIVVPLRVNTTVALAYWIVAFSMAAVTAYSLYATRQMWAGPTIAAIEKLALATLGALAIVILFTGIRHRHPLVARKVRAPSVAVLLFCGTCAVLLAAVLARTMTT